MFINFKPRAFNQVLSIRHKLSLKEWDLEPTRNQLVTSITGVPLLYHFTAFVWKTGLEALKSLKLRKTIAAIFT